MAKRVVQRPAVQRFEIKDTDEVYDPIIVVVNQSTETDYGQLMDRARPQVSWDEEGNPSQKSNLNPIFLRRYAAYRTLGSVGNLVDEEGKELFRSATEGKIERVRHAMSESEFNDVWDILDPKILDEIAKCVMQVNPTLRLAI